MTISCARLENEIILDEGRPFVLRIENPREYFRAVNGFIGAFEGAESEMAFWENGTEIKANSYGEIVTDLFTFELTDRKIITLLYKKLQKDLVEGELFIQFQTLCAEAEKFLEELCSEENFALEYDGITLETLLKGCSVKPAKNYESLLEKIICYINLFTLLKGITFFVFIGLKNFLSDEELGLLYKHCHLNKVALLLIEGEISRRTLPAERAVIITEDLCEIVENFE